MKCSASCTLLKLKDGTGISTITEYYAVSNSDTTEPTVWYPTVQTMTPDNRFLWNYEVITYTDDTTPKETAKRVIGAYGQQGIQGETGSFLSFNASQTQIDCYAEGDPISDENIMFTATSDLDITFYIDGTVKKIASQILSYSDTPSNLFGSKTSIVVKAKAGTLEQSYTISKVKRTGVINITADKLTIGYYADNVPHDNTETVTLTFSTENYKTYPKLYINGTEKTIEKSHSSQTYTFTPSEIFGTGDSIICRISVDSANQNLVISKVKDKGSIDIASSLTVFDYYADNVPVNTANNAVLTISQQGYSKMPKLYIEGAETTYSNGTYSIAPLTCQNVLSIGAEIKNDYESKSLTITKVKQQPNIAISSSLGAVDYYYDGVANAEDIEISVTYSGLFYAPLCRVGDNAITLNDQGKGTLPISWFNSAEGGLVVTAYAQKSLVCESSVTITKNIYPLMLSIGASSTQFSYDTDGVATPESITLKNNTTGLSSKSLVNLVVGGEAKSWTDGAFTVTPDMITGRYLAVSIGYGTESQSMLITKTFDGKAEIIEYAKTQSFRIYPNDEYEFSYNETGVTYNGATMTWTVPWSSTQPDISSNEYLWRRSRVKDTDAWQYTRLTGIKGDDGKAGIYLGHYTEAPTTKSDGSDINDGDFYLNTATEGSPLPYLYKNGSWLLITTENSAWSQIASAVMNDVNNYGGSLLSTSAFYGFFQLLSAQKAFIKSLGTQEITLNNGGAIQSDNYKTSEGAEGFKIDSDGRADFTEGTWRGSFANGLSFIPETNLSIKKTMTHKEVYQAMKKAGIVEGVYQVANDSTFINDGYVTGSSTERVLTMNTVENVGDGLSILEYSNGSLSCGLPLFIDCTGTIPLTPNIYLSFVFDITKDSNTNISTLSKEAYLRTKSYVVKINNLWAANGEYLSGENTNYPVDVSSWMIAQYGDNYKVLIYGTVIDGKILIYNKSNSYNVYSLNSTAMSLNLDGTFSLPEGWDFARWIYPTFYFHTITNGYRASLLNSTFTQFKFMTTPDLLTYTDDGYAYTYVTPTGIDTLLPFDIIKVGTRIFAQVMEQFTRDEETVSRYYFAEYNTTTQSFDQIPDEYTCVEQLNTLNLIPLQEKDGIIIGTFSGKDLFTYNTTTNVYTDLSWILKSVASYIESSISYSKNVINDKPPYYIYNVQALKRCYRSDNSNKKNIKYSLNMYAPNIDIKAIQYSTKYGCFLVVVKVEGDENINYIIYKYNHTTGKAEMLSPGIMEFGYNMIYNNIVPFTENSTGSYALAVGSHIIVDSLDTSDFVNVEVNNITGADAVQFLNGDRTADALMGVNNISGIHNSLDPQNSYLKDLLTASLTNYPNNTLKLFNTTDTKIKINAPVPFFKIRKIAIREDNEFYKIIPLEQVHAYDNIYKSPLNNLCGGISDASSHGFFIHSNGASIEPILTIDKDSTEQLGVSFYWDFPAQLTVSETVKKVVRADVFRDNLKIK